MKKTTSLFLGFALYLILCAALMTDWDCEHQWKDATCTSPKTCSLCEAIEGESLGHTWVGVDWEHSEVCASCGKTKDQALDNH